MSGRDKAIHLDRARAPVYLQTEGGSDRGREEGRMTKGPGFLGSGPWGGLTARGPWLQYPCAGWIQGRPEQVFLNPIWKTPLI